MTLSDHSFSYIHANRCLLDIVDDDWVLEKIEDQPMISQTFPPISTEDEEQESKYYNSIILQFIDFSHIIHNKEVPDTWNELDLEEPL